MDRQFTFVTISYVPDVEAGSLGSRMNIGIAVIDPDSSYEEPAEVRIRDSYLDLVAEFGTEEDCPFVRNTLSQLSRELPKCRFPRQPIDLLRRLLTEYAEVLSVSNYRSAMSSSGKILADDLERKYLRQAAASAKPRHAVSCGNTTTH